MNAKHFLMPLAGMAIFLASCEEKVKKFEDSSLITVSSPAKNQVVEDKDSVVIEAVIKPQNKRVTSYSVTVKTQNDKTVFSAQRGCDCASINEVKFREAFLYDANKTTDVSLEIVAVLSDNSETRERIPFTIKD